MERTVSMNYPVVRQNKHVILNTFIKHHGRKIQHCTLIKGSKKGLNRMYRMKSNDCGFL